MFGRKSKEVAPVRLDKGPLGSTAVTLSDKLIKIGIGGRPPFESAEKIATDALRDHGTPDKAIDHIVSETRRLVAAGGFLTGLGGFVVMPVSMPANVLEFYLLSTRMVGAIAHVRGYDLKSPGLRTAILLSLVGAEADELLKKAGVVATGRLASLATQGLPAPVLMVVNKAIGFRLVSEVGGKFLARAGKGIPVAGGAISAGLDVYLLNKIAKNAKEQFPPATAGHIAR